MSSFVNVICVECKQLPTHGVQATGLTNAREGNPVYCWECFLRSGLDGAGSVPLADDLSNIIEKMKSAGISACNEGCGHLVVNSEDALSHANECPQKKLLCEHCQEVFCAKDMKQHVDYYCERVPVSCLCGEMVPRNENDEHFRTTCPEVTEVCEFCEKSIRRGDMEAHRANAVEEHLRYVKELAMRNANNTAPVNAARTPTSFDPSTPLLRQYMERMSRRKVLLHAANAFFIYYVWVLLPLFIALPVLAFGAIFYSKKLTQKQSARRIMRAAQNPQNVKPNSYEWLQRKKRRNLLASAGFVLVAVHYPLVAAFLPFFGRE